MQSTKYNISEFKNAIKLSTAFNLMMDPHLFDGIPNPQFYIPILDTFKTALENEEMNVPIELRPIYQSFNDALYNLLFDAINLFIILNDRTDEITEVELESNGYYTNLLLDLKRINESIQHIQYNILRGNNSVAINMKRYFQLFFSNTISKLENDFSIDILSSPLKDNFIEVNKNIESSINLDEIKIVNRNSIINADTTKHKKSNDEIELSISMHLDVFEENLTEENRELLNDLLYMFFSEGITSSDKMVAFKKVNKKNVGWVLKEIYREITGSNITIDYLRFAQNNIDQVIK
jgi:hypothetical protein